MNVTDLTKEEIALCATVIAELRREKQRLRERIGDLLDSLIDAIVALDVDQPSCGGGCGQPPSPDDINAEFL